METKYPQKINAGSCSNGLQVGQDEIRDLGRLQCGRVEQAGLTGEEKRAVGGERIDRAIVRALDQAGVAARG